ncbi:MAG: acyl-CoA thioesterase [Oligoflexia bacterium]|nr:acyl-CoA thioesterase [Oligoflexia bacterium]
MNIYKLKISPEHLDLMGHMNHVTYLRLMEEARWDLYNNLGYTKENIQEDGKGPIVLGVNIKYRKEIVLNENIIIKSECSNYSGLLGKMTQVIFKENGVIAATAEVTFGYFDLINRKLLLPSGKWFSIHKELMNGAEK